MNGLELIPSRSLKDASMWFSVTIISMRLAHQCIGQDRDSALVDSI